MVRLPKKEPYEITLENLAPPYLDYEYFTHCDQLPFRYDANVFDIVNAWWLIEAATLVYADEAFVIDKFSQNAGLAEIRHFGGKSTQCFVASNAKFAIVAFRGSESRLRAGDADHRHILADWLVNIDFLPEPWERGGRVHTGFKNALQQVWPDLEAYISALQKNNRKIWLTGHSLGAALATLAADCYGNVQGIYTYGSPRVGDRNFGEAFKADAYRFVNNSDIVTRVPPAAMYTHVGQLKYIDSEGRLRDGHERGSNWTDEIERKFDHIMSALGPAAKGFTEVLMEPIVDHVPTRYAVQIWNNIPLVGKNLIRFAQNWNAGTME